MKFKKVAALGMAALMAASLGACGGSGGSESGSGKDDKSLNYVKNKSLSNLKRKLCFFGICKGK